MGAGHLTIDLEAVAANWAALDAYSGDDVETAAVIKADAYGLSARKIGPRLLKAGVQTFFVATVGEGQALRPLVGEADIFVFAGHMDGDSGGIESAGLIPLLNSPDQVTRHFSLLPGKPFGIQLDTGMNRLGLEPGDWQALSSELMVAGPRLVMSHLACADEPDHPMNAHQLRAFREMTNGIAHRRSLAATGGTLLGREYHFEMTRPGIGLYGGLPFQDATPVAKLDLPVIQIRIVRPFETVGYGNSWEAKVESCIATVAAGYADGLIRAMGPNARLFAGDVPCPIAGRVSMDLITVDVTHLDEVPDYLTILGYQQGVDSLADAAGTIGYEILTSLGDRYERAYV